MHPICRTCLGDISDDNFLILTEDKESMRVKKELSVCVPEIVIDIVINPVLCLKCVHALHSTYEFKTQCWHTEERINNYIKNPNPAVNSDFNVQKLQFTSLQFCMAAVNKTSINASLNPTARDIVDDLNNLLDEALQNIPNRYDDKHNYVECEDDFFDQCVIEPQVIVESDEDQESIILQNNVTLKECTVVCEKLPDDVVNSKLKIMSSMHHMSKSKIKTNKKRQRGGRVFKCSKCAYKSLKKLNLNKHKKLHTSNKFFLCNICSYRCETNSSFIRHQASHAVEKPFSCEICPYKGACKDNLRKHISRIHGVLNFLKPYACEICPYKGTCKANLQQHTCRMHGGGKKFFLCNICNYSCSYRHNFKRHMTTHTGEKPFSCKMCSYKAALKENLNRHIRTHSDKKVFKAFTCNICPYKSEYNYLLKRHTKMHSDNKDMLSNITFSST